MLFSAEANVGGFLGKRWGEEGKGERKRGGAEWHVGVGGKRKEQEDGGWEMMK